MFFNTYLLPYIKSPNYVGIIEDSTYSGAYQMRAPYCAKFILANGVRVAMRKDGGVHSMIYWVDVNGNTKPNKLGVDVFTFNGGSNIKAWADGLPASPVRNDYLALCSNYPDRCAPLIQYDGWEIKDDYPW